MHVSEQLGVEALQLASSPPYMARLIQTLLYARSEHPKALALWRSIKHYVLLKRQMRRWAKGQTELCPGTKAVDLQREDVEMLKAEIATDVGQAEVESLTLEIGRTLNHRQTNTQ